MERDELVAKLESLKAKWEEVAGPVTDIWLPDELMQVLDERSVLDRLGTPYMMDETYVTNFRPLQEGQIRVAFLTTLGDDDELISTKRSASNSKQTFG